MMVLKKEVNRQFGAIVFRVFPNVPFGAGYYEARSLSLFIRNLSRKARHDQKTMLGVSQGCQHSSSFLSQRSCCSKLSQLLHGNTRNRAAFLRLRPNVRTSISVGSSIRRGVKSWLRRFTLACCSRPAEEVGVGAGLAAPTRGGVASIPLLNGKITFDLPDHRRPFVRHRRCEDIPTPHKLNPFIRRQHSTNLGTNTAPERRG